jgi:Golgi apyrase
MPRKVAKNNRTWLRYSLLALFVALAAYRLLNGWRRAPDVVPRFGIVVDAGSSGSRLYVYRWDVVTDKSNDTEVVSIDNLLPVYHGDSTKRASAKHITPGLSDVQGGYDAVVKYLEPLLQFAYQTIPPAMRSKTPMILKGTAGMRLLPKERADELLRHVRRVVATTTDFMLPDGVNDTQWISIADGDAEARAMWRSIEYLLRRAGERAPVVGSLDLGGGSTQIAFPLENGELYTASFGKYGVNEARYRYYRALRAAAAAGASSDGDVLHDPCLPRGAEQSLGEAMATRCTSSGGTELAAVDATLAPVRLRGASDGDECAALVRGVLNLNATCARAPCSFDGVWQPAVPRDAVFVGRDHFVRVLRLLALPGRPRLSEWRARTAALCALSGEEFARAHADAKHAFYCFEATYILALLVDAYRFALDEAPILFTHDVAGVDPSWTIEVMRSYAKAIASDEN